MTYKPKLYVESSIISYLVARPSRDIILQARQQITREWWDTRKRFTLHVSPLVIDEIAMGDPDAAERRLATVADIEVLSLTKAVYEIAEQLTAKNVVPVRYRTDALHIATAAAYEMDYLITWNQAHIANPATMRVMQDVIKGEGLIPPLFVRPDYFLEIGHE